MAGIAVTDTLFPEVKIIEPTCFEDKRGYFYESYSRQAFAEYGLNAVFLQDNQSFTRHKGTIRGIHCQNAPKAQLKLVRCTRGVIRDYVVDFRRNSPTYRRWISVELSDENRKQLWIPKGFGHAFLTLRDNCEIQYKVDEVYVPDCDRSVVWNDPEIAVDWGINAPILSDKDRNAPLLASCDLNFSE